MVNKIRVLHITASLKVGGAETVLVSLLRELQKGKSALIFANTVCYFHTGPNLLELEKLALPVLQVRGKFYQYDPWFIVRLYKLIKQTQPDIIHSSLWIANLMARIFGKFLGIPVIATVHSPVNFNNFKNTNKNTNGIYCFRTLVDKLTAHWAQITVAVSASTAQQLQQDLTNLKNITIIPNGINNLAEQDESSRSGNKLNILANSFVIGTVGRLVASKNYGNLITCFANLQARYHNLILAIIGSGELELILKAQVASLNLNHKIFFVQSSRAIDYYSSFDCFVQPSYYEGLSVALLEAGLCKLPVIASYNYNLKHDLLINNYSGLLINPYNNAALLELELALEQLILDRQLCIKLGENLFKTVTQDFSLAQMVNSYKNLYLKIYANPPAP